MESNQSGTGDDPVSSQSENDSDDLKPILALMEEGISPRLILNQISPGLSIPPDADDLMLWRSIMNILDPPRRKKLSDYNSLDDTVKLINASKNIVVLSGAGISTSAGIPDFRSRNGIYVQIHAQYPDLRDPKMMFDINYFRNNPLPFYQFAKALFPGQFMPTIGHKFIKSIEDHGKLLRNYTQNIDTLEKQTGIQRVIECHGSFALASCTRCARTVDGNSIKQDVLTHTVPRCSNCPLEQDMPLGLGVMKPNIVFFGEQLGDEFHRSFDEDREKVDLLIVIGSSLKVRPVALIPKSIPANVPQILINREPLDHLNFDIELLGNCDDIIQELCIRLGQQWVDVCEKDAKPLTEIVGIPSSYLNIDDPDKSNQSNDVLQSTNFVSEHQPEKKHTIKSSIEESKAIEIVCEDSPFNKETDKCQPNVEQDDDEDWEDMEIISSSDESDETDSSSESPSTVNLKVTEGSYIFVEPNVYLFNGVELTRTRLREYTKEPCKPIRVKHKQEINCNESTANSRLT